eukprot:13790181-Ditylum_brightwellii.AAC.1
MKEQRNIKAKLAKQDQVYGYQLILGTSLKKIKLPSYKTVTIKEPKIVDFEYLASYILGVAKEDI